MPLVNRTDITDPVTPAKLEVILKPIRILQWNGKIDEQNFTHVTPVTKGIPLHAGSMIRNITDLVDSAKTFDGRSIYTELDTANAQIGATAVWKHFSNVTANNEKDFFTVHAKVANALYKQEHSTRDIEYKLSHTRDDIKNSFRTKKEWDKKIKRLEHRLESHYGGILAVSKKAHQLERELKKTRDAAHTLLHAGAFDYEFISLSQSIEVELPTGYVFDKWEIFGDLDWGWKNEVGDEKMAVGVLYVELDNTRDDFICFKLSILFDQDVALSEDDYVLCAGKLQYRVKRYA